MLDLVGYEINKIIYYIVIQASTMKEFTSKLR